MNVSHEGLTRKKSWKAHVTNKATTRRLFAPKKLTVLCRLYQRADEQRRERTHLYQRPPCRRFSGGKITLSLVSHRRSKTVKDSTQRLWRLRSRKPLELLTFEAVVVHALCLPACLPTDRPPIGPFKSEVHPKLQRLAPPRDGDEVTASLRSTLAIPSSRARSVRLDDCAVSRYDRGAEWKERTGERMGERGKALLWQQNRTGCSAMAFLFQATGVCAAGLCVCVEEDLHNRGYLLQSASRCSKTRLGIPFVTFSERDSLMCLFCVFQP